MLGDETNVGRRIAVVGTPGCGKSYVAEVLAAKLGISYICSDAVNQGPGWQLVPHEERVAQLDASTSAEAWTFDGNLAARHPEDRVVLDRCDTIVWLDLPRWQVWSQVTWRTLVRVATRKELWHGNRESLRTLFSRDSIILLSIKTFSRRRRAYAAQFAAEGFETAIIGLRSRGEVERWLESVPSVVPSSDL